MAGTTPWSRAPLDALPRGRARATAASALALLLSVDLEPLPARLLQVLQLRASDSWNALAAAIGVEAASLDIALRVTLPLGISFYTFQSMSYTIDVYRGDAKAHAQLRRLRLLRLDVPAARGRPDHPLLGGRRPAREPHAHAGEVRARRRLLLASAWRRRCCWPTRAGKIADTVFDAGALDRARRLVRRRRLRLPDLLRLLRLLRHGDRPRPDVRLRLRRRTSTRPTGRSRSPSSGGAGTSRSRPGCATTSTSRWAATARACAAPTSTWPSSCCWAGCGTAPSWNFVVWGAFHGALLAARARRRKRPPLRLDAARRARRARPSRSCW